MNWLFFIVLILFALCIFRGYKRGLLRIVYSMVSWIIIFAIVSWATPFIHTYLKTNTSIYTAIAENVEEQLKQAANEKSLPETADYAQQLESIGISLPAPLMDELISFAADSTDQFMQESGLYSQVALSLADFAVKGLSSLIAWVFAGLIVSIVSQFLGIVSKIPIVRGINRYLGAAAGILYGLLIVWTSFCVIALCGASKFGLQMITFIQENQLLTALYNHNPVLAVLSRFL